MGKSIKINKKIIKRILIIRLRRIGDVLLTTPLLRNLRNNFPKACITYVVGEKASAILRNNPYTSELIIVDKKIFSEIIRKKIYDLTIDLTANSTSSLLCALSGAKYRVGVYGGRAVGRYYNIVLDNPIKGIDVVDYSLSLLKIFGLINDGNKKTEIYLSPKEIKIAQKRLSHFRKRIIGIQPVSNTGRPLWPTENFVRLTDSLIKRYNAEAIIFQGPGEKKISLKTRNSLKQKAVLLPVLKLREYLAILNQCNLFIANDGGQLHMAAALGIPTVGILCSSDHDFWFFYKEKFIKIISENIKDISVGQVIREIETNKLIK